MRRRPTLCFWFPSPFLWYWKVTLAVLWCQMDGGTNCRSWFCLTKKLLMVLLAQRTDIHFQLMGTSGTHSYVGQFQTFLKDFTIDQRDWGKRIFCEDFVKTSHIILLGIFESSPFEWRICWFGLLMVYCPPPRLCCIRCWLQGEEQI